MDIVEICKHLNMSPLIVDPFNPDEKNMSVDKVLERRVQNVLDKLEQDDNEARTLITVAESEARKQLKDHPDLIHMIKNVSELSSLLSIIPFNQIIFLLNILSKTEASQQSWSSAIPTLTQTEKVSLTAASAQKMLGLQSMEIFTLMSSVPLMNYSSRFFNRLFLRLTEDSAPTELDRLIASYNGEGLKEILKEVPVARLSQALIVIRHTESFEKQAKKCISEKPSTEASSTVSGFFPKSKAGISVSPQMRELQSSYQVHVTVSKVLEILKGNPRYFETVQLLFFTLEQLNSSEKLVESEPNLSWADLVNQHRYICSSLVEILTHYQEIKELLNGEQIEKFKYIINNYLPSSLMTYFVNAICMSPNPELNSFLSTKRLNYYMEKSAMSPESHPLLLASKSNSQLKASVDESAESSDDEIFYDARPGEDDASFIVIDSEVVRASDPIVALYRAGKHEDFRKDLIQCLENSEKKYADLIASHNYSENTVKKRSFLARCHVILSGVNLETESYLRDFAACAVLAHAIIAFKTAKHAVYRDTAADIEEIETVFKKYNFSVDSSKKDQIIEALNSGLSPFAIFSLYGLHHNLSNIEIKNYSSELTIEKTGVIASQTIKVAAILAGVAAEKCSGLFHAVCDYVREKDFLNNRQLVVVPSEKSSDSSSDSSLEEFSPAPTRK